MNHTISGQSDDNEKLYIFVDGRELDTLDIPLPGFESRISVTVTTTLHIRVFYITISGKNNKLSKHHLKNND